MNPASPYEAACLKVALCLTDYDAAADPDYAEAIRRVDAIPPVYSGATHNILRQEAIYRELRNIKREAARSQPKRKAA